MDVLETYTPQISVLGAILLQPELMGEAMLSLTADDFQSGLCRAAWQAMTDLFRNGKTPDVILVKDALNGFPDVPQFLTSCMEAAPMASGFRDHVDALRKQAMLCRLRDIGRELMECSDIDEAAALMDRGNAATVRCSARERRNMAEMFRSFGDRHSSSAKPDFLPWPIKPLNEGVKVVKGKYIVIGGYPSDGKTAFALQCAIAQADGRRKVAFYSFETDADTVEDRAMSCMANISMNAIQNNRLDDDDWARYAHASGHTEKPFQVVAASDMTVDDIRADALANRYQVIYIDYLQLINPPRRSRYSTRYEEVTEISRSLQKLAKSTGITVVALSQMSRPSADKKSNISEPTMHNLRESGQIEQDADVIMLLYRTNQRDILAPRYLTVGKNKEGATGTWMLDFDGKHQRFSMSPYQGESPLAKVKGKTKPTPVLDQKPEREIPGQYSILNGDDPLLPF